MRGILLLWGFLVPVICFHGDLTLALKKSENLKSEFLAVLNLLEEAGHISRSHDYYNDNERRVSDWLNTTNEHLRRWSERLSLASWEYETDISDTKADKLNEVSAKFATWKKDMTKDAESRITVPGLSAESRRQLRLLVRDSDPPTPDKVRKLRDLQSKLEGIYAKGRVIDGDKVYNMEPELTDLMAKVRDPQKLSFLWKAWRDVTGKKMTPFYAELVGLMNEGAKEHAYHDAGEAWRESQFDETPTLVQDTALLWEKLRPMYLQLHTFVRKRLKEYYYNTHPGYKFPEDGTIPAHLLGNMWAQQWDNIYDIVKPFPDVPEEDLDAEMKKKNYNIGNMFRVAEEFYTSLGLFPMTEDFWRRSMLARPKDKDREVQCHASAFDFYTQNMFRIKMCTKVNMDYFETIHHEMGHIEYFMAYRNQPAVYRDGANCAFHEAIGDTIALSVRTRKHLETIGLMSPTKNQDIDLKSKQDINYLMRKALLKIAFLPFGYMIDKWRWSVFNGTTTPQQYNEYWWKLRLQYQGLSSPVPRSTNDFDPGSKFHIPANSPYICYFVSFIIQFQFYEALCNESGHQGPLYTCDFYRSIPAGDKLKAMLELGSSKPWRQAMDVITGENKVNTDSIMRYFEPLMVWLKKENENEDVGWDKADIKSHWI